MTKYIIILLSIVTGVVTLSGCTMTPKEKIVTKEVLIEKIPLNLDMPKPFVWQDFEIIVVTKDNFDDVMKELENSGKSLALFAFDKESYEALTINVTEMKRYMSEQKVIILEYKDYYENNNNKE